VPLSQTSALLAYLAFALIIGVYLHYNSWLLWLAWSLRDRKSDRPEPPTEWPLVTVQLPIYNEPEVVERLLRAVAALDYPRDRLQIQLLDDSTDGITPEIGARVVEELSDEGVEIEEIRRTNRVGYKAGALQEAMPWVRGDFILLLDADFVPSPDLLRRLLPWFADPRIGMVQACWGSVSPPRTLVERCSTHWSERHFGIEQFARSRSGQFFHFNGSGGIWRRAAIEQSGGWSAETLAEDLELSYRAWTNGWRFHFDNEVVVPASPPPDMPALRIQQARWSRGAFQVARKLASQVGTLPIREQFRLMMHSTGYAFGPLLLGFAMVSGPAAWARGAMSSEWALLLVDIPAYIFLGGMVAQVAYRWWARGPRAGLVELEVAMVGLGLSWLILRHAVKGWNVPGGEFVRTPKVSGRSGPPAGEVRGELVLAAMASGSAFLALIHGAWHLAVLPLFATGGLALCVLLTFHASRRSSAHAPPAPVRHTAPERVHPAPTP